MNEFKGDYPFKLTFSDGTVVNGTGVLICEYKCDEVLNDHMKDDNYAKMAVITGEMECQSLSQHQLNSMINSEEPTFEGTLYRDGLKESVRMKCRILDICIESERLISYSIQGCGKP